MADDEFKLRKTRFKYEPFVIAAVWAGVIIALVQMICTSS